MNRLANTSCAAAIVAAVAAFGAAPVLAGDITAEWANVTPPPAPELKQATVDPKTLKVTEYILPDPKTRVRRMGVTTDDMLWYGDWSNGKLSRFNPKTGEVKS